MKRRRIIVSYRRKRQGKTDYKLRLGLIKSGKPRLVIRRSNKNLSAQIVEFFPAGDKVLISAHTRELSKYGYNYNCCNTPAAYLLGVLLGKKARDKVIKEAIMDIGLKRKSERLFAFIAGASELIKIPHSKEDLPKTERLLGKHIEEYKKIRLGIDKIKEKILGR